MEGVVPQPPLCLAVLLYRRRVCEGHVLVSLCRLQALRCCLSAAVTRRAGRCGITSPDVPWACRVSTGHGRLTWSVWHDGCGATQPPEDAALACRFDVEPRRRLLVPTAAMAAADGRVEVCFHDVALLQPVFMASLP